MHVTHFDVQASPLAAFSAPPFRPEEWRNLGLAIGAPGRQSGQRHHPTDSSSPVEQCMSPIWTTMHHHSPRSRPRHSGPRSGETSALRLARLAAHLGKGIIQQTPRSALPPVPAGRRARRGAQYAYMDKDGSVRSWRPWAGNRRVLPGDTRRHCSGDHRAQLASVRER